MSRYVFDIETNGVNFNNLQDTLHTIHDIVLKDIDTGEILRCNDRDSVYSISNGITFLDDAEEIIGHNIQGFDIPAIQVLHPDFNPKGKVTDTKILSKTIYPDLKDKDFSITLQKKPEYPKQLIGSHSLEAWGHRIGTYKDDFSSRMKGLGLDPWGDLPPEYVKEREDYCVKDVEVNHRLYLRLMSKGFSEDSLQLEHDVRRIINRQEKHGFAFDVEAAQKLHVELIKRKEELTAELRKVFKPFYIKDGKETYFKRDMKRWKAHPLGAHERKGVKGYYEYVVASEPMDAIAHQKIKLTDFNPGSRHHIGIRLQKLYGWKPKAFGADGKATVDEAVLGPLKYPPIPLLVEYLLVNKRLGMLAEGKEAWLKCEKNGRVYGKVDTMGAVTSRMTHSRPNVAQTPAGYSPYGTQCRALFTVPPGKRLVGMDADALELRCLAGYMARYDKGEYIKVVLEGKKEDGTDIHSRNQRAIGLNSRDNAKTWFYAFIYGAGDYKLGQIIKADMKKAERSPIRGRGGVIALGKASRDNFEKNLPALGKLVERVKDAVKKRKKIRGLDGRFHPARGEHSALNTLLQGAGAILMKRCLVLVDEAAQARGWVPGFNYEFVANVHDELQVEVDEEIAEEFGKLMTDQLEEAGKYYDFKCPITGNYDVGITWAETH